jgi:hypothetical protein
MGMPPLFVDSMSALHACHAVEASGFDNATRLVSDGARGLHVCVRGGSGVAASANYRCAFAH